MTKNNRADLYSLTKLLRITDQETTEVCYQVMRESHELVEIGNDFTFYAPKGDTLPVCLVAHVDTVRRDSTTHHIPNLLFHKGIVSNPDGVLGADDRAGVYIILEIIKRYKEMGQPLPYVLFTDREEIGGIGAEEFAQSGIMDAYQDSINLFVEYDRKGGNEMVFYDDPEVDLITFLAQFGYKENMGSYSDVATISEYCGIGHVNLSAGYYKQHTKSEFLVLNEMNWAIDTALTMLPKIDRQYISEPMEYNWTGKWWRDYGISDEEHMTALPWEDDDDNSQGEDGYCESCYEYDSDCRTVGGPEYGGEFHLCPYCRQAFGLDSDKWVEEL